MSDREITNEEKYVVLKKIFELVSVELRRAFCLWNIFDFIQ